MSKLLNAIRTAIALAERAGVTRYQIAKETGVSQATLSRFMSGERGLGPEKIEQLADFLGLEIVIRPKQRKQSR